VINIKKKTIVIASNNPGKIKEMSYYLKKINSKILVSKNFKLKEPEENGKTFEQNALIKARYVNKRLGRIALADDSGLVVPSLQGKPGIYSARLAGKNRNFSLAMKKLNSLLFRKKPNAYYISVLAFSWGKKREKTFTGKIFGNLTWPPRGCFGFGYDPIFVPNGYNKTFGEIKESIKNKISHRAIAFKKFVDFLN
tara:strand:+ start:165 stop:752 length:588 start_codon:yes stop_codon:yes gene_type:complete